MLKSNKNHFNVKLLRGYGISITKKGHHEVTAKNYASALYSALN